MATTSRRDAMFLACLFGGMSLYFVWVGATGTSLRPGWPPASAYAGAALCALFTADAAYLAYRPADLNSKRVQVMDRIGWTFEAIIYGLGAIVGVAIGFDWLMLRLLGRAGPPNEDQRVGLWVIAGIVLLGAAALLGRERGRGVRSAEGDEERGELR